MALRVDKSLKLSAYSYNVIAWCAESSENHCGIGVFGAPQKLGKCCNYKAKRNFIRR